MVESSLSQYKCVNCGEDATALYKTYGPSVLKLTKCENCKGLVDKYIEYDPVIVMIDLVLMSKEAQRHVIYNIEFKSYWKLFIVLIMLETYGVWRNDSLFNIAVNSICDIKNNSTINTTYIDLPINLSLPEPWNTSCKGWEQEEKDMVDLFIWEKDFYIQFLSTFAGIVIFIAISHLMMSLFTSSSSSSSSTNTVPLKRLLKSFSLANTCVLWSLPTLVWAEGSTPETRLLHYSMVFLYGTVVFYNVFRVIYEGSRSATVLVLILSNCLKCLTTFHFTPYIRRLIT